VDAATSSSLREGAAALGVALGQEQLVRFGAYFDLLARWNARLNLTRIIAPGEVVSKHFLDSLAILPHLGDAQELLDVGSGAGFPGIPAAIGRPGLRVTLVEATQKKAAFLEAVKRELSLPLTIRAERFEALSPTPFGAVVSRATLDPARWVAAGAPWVAPGGRLLAMLGRDRPALAAPPGFQGPTVHPYTLADGDRAIVVFERT
jgi:16S rRNA (guanine527-N7)-methyltransferase